MLYLLSVVNLQQVVASELHIRELLVVFKEVNGEVHLAGRASCYKRRDRCFSQDAFVAGKATEKKLQDELASFGNAHASQLYVFINTPMETFLPRHSQHSTSS